MHTFMLVGLLCRWFLFLVSQPYSRYHMCCTMACSSVAPRMCMACWHSTCLKIYCPNPGFCCLSMPHSNSSKSAQAERSGLSVSALSTLHACTQGSREAGGDMALDVSLRHPGHGSLKISKRCTFARNSQVSRVFLLHCRAQPGQTSAP